MEFAIVAYEKDLAGKNIIRSLLEAERFTDRGLFHRLTSPNDVKLGFSADSSIAYLHGDGAIEMRKQPLLVPGMIHPLTHFGEILTALKPN